MTSTTARRSSLNRRTLLSLAGAASAASLLGSPALAYDENSTSAVNVDRSGLALKGHDPVAYFTAGQPTKGQIQFSVSHRGATYWFATAANRDAFKANPDKFAPQYGGFCAMGVALDKKLDGDPNAWKIVDNKLYLNVNKDVQKKWLEDVPGIGPKTGRAMLESRDSDAAPKELERCRAAGMNAHLAKPTSRKARM